MAILQGSLMMKSMMFSCALLWSSSAFAGGDKPETRAGEAKIAQQGGGEQKEVDSQLVKDTGDRTADKPGDKDVKEDDKEHEQAGGKFSLFSHECKAEDEDALETTPGSPPLDVDDPATPGCNGWEINIVTSAELGKHMTGETPLFDINYGIGDNLQLKYEIPYDFARQDGVSTSGFGRAELGLKYRFYDNEASGTTVAVYPQLEFAMPGTAAAHDGDTSLVTKLPLLVSAKLGETSKGDIMISANLGYNMTNDAMAEHYVSASVGVGLPLLSKVAVMIEGSTEQALASNMENVREHIYKANLGFIGAVSKHLLWFGSVGQSFASSDADDPNHTCLLLGLRIIAGGP
jgi:hypothetical protein